jgi:hypothetical protein
MLVFVCLLGVLSQKTQAVRGVIDIKIHLLKVKVVDIFVQGRHAQK